LLIQQEGGAGTTLTLQGHPRLNKMQVLQLTIANRRIDDRTSSSQMASSRFAAVQRGLADPWRSTCDAFGPEPPVGVASCCVASFPEAAVQAMPQPGIESGRFSHGWTPSKVNRRKNLLSSFFWSARLG